VLQSYRRYVSFNALIIMAMEASKRRLCCFFVRNVIPSVVGGTDQILCFDEISVSVVPYMALVPLLLLIHLLPVGSL
jgi:hypothetical protein